jgi:hypothetical protein
MAHPNIDLVTRTIRAYRRANAARDCDSLARFYQGPALARECRIVRLSYSARALRDAGYYEEGAEVQRRIDALESQRPGARYL